MYVCMYVRIAPCRNHVQGPTDYNEAQIYAGMLIDIETYAYTGHTYNYICIFIHRHTYICVCVPYAGTCVHAYINKCVFMYVNVHVCSKLRTVCEASCLHRVRLCVHACIPTGIHIM